jgi:hypothetical protein
MLLSEFLSELQVIARCAKRWNAKKTNAKANRPRRFISGRFSGEWYNNYTINLLYNRLA